MFSWRDATNEDVLRAWDAGESVWSCSLGGLGPGYEQTIQLMGFEMLRAMVANPPQVGWEKMATDRKANEAYWALIEALPQVQRVMDKLGPSGAQHGAARNIAGVFARQGYSKGMEMVPDDRRIQVRKRFPSLDDPAPECAAETMTAPTHPTPAT